jgi:hypothetical protein
MHKQHLSEPQTLCQPSYNYFTTAAQADSLLALPTYAAAAKKHVR